MSRGDKNTLTASDIFSLFWNFMVSFFNILNFVYFMVLSQSYNVIEILQTKSYVNSGEMNEYYTLA